MGGERPFRDTAVYHCQQTVEKALKGMLTHWGVAFQKTHDLRVLLSQCAAQDPRFETWRDAVEELTPYATLFRYPGDAMEPTPEDAGKALTMAGDILAFVEQCLQRAAEDGVG